MAVAAYAEYQATTKDLAKLSTKCQTTYRESETQTDPWLPPYSTHCEPGIVPEIITLSEFTWGKGLPFSRLDVFTVDRTRKRKAWTQLFKRDDSYPINVVRAAQTQLDLDDMAFMELLIDYENEERFELAAEALEVSRLRAAKNRNDKVSKVIAKKKQDLTVKKKNLKKYLDRQIRIQNNRDRMVNFRHHSDMLEKYLKKSSNVCVFPARYIVDYKYKHEHLAVTFEDEFDLFCKIDKNKMYKKSDVSYYIKKHVCDKQFWPAYHYKDIHLSVKRMPEEQEIFEEEISSISVPCLRYENLQKAIVYIQRLIRGRAEQTMMHLDRVKFLDTISLLRETYGFTKQTIRQADEQRVYYETSIRKYNFTAKILATVMGVINQAQSAVVSSILDFTHKEMARLQSERTVFDYVKAAHMTRWGRESREGALRQKELRRRRQHEEMFRTVSKAKEVYVDEFLTNLMDEAFTVEAERSAREAAEIKADLVDPRFFEKTTEALERDMIIARLAFSYIFPESVRLPNRIEVEERQERHRREAYKAIFGCEEKDFPEDETPSEKELRLLRLKKDQEATEEFQVIQKPSMEMDQDQINEFLKEFLMEAVERMKYADKILEDEQLPITITAPSLTSISASSLSATNEESCTSREESEHELPVLSTSSDPLFTKK